MRKNVLVVTVGVALVALPALAFADGDGATTGLVGGAVAGAIVGGPVGAVVGGVAGTVVGGAITGPSHETVVLQPAALCNSSTTQTTDASGDTRTTQSTNCAN